MIFFLKTYIYILKIDSVGSTLAVLYEGTLNCFVLTGVYRLLIVPSACVLEQNRWVRKAELFVGLNIQDLTAFQEGLNSFLSH